LRIFVFLLLSYANLSQALGIGDIALQSHLGEPLIAKINVTDVEKLPDTSCFSVTDTSDVPAFRRANISLKKSNDGYQLNISTHDAITEPIVNLHLSFHCEPNFSREYVLLLDPASLVISNSPSISEQPASSNAAGNATDQNNVLPLKTPTHIDEKSDAESNASTAINPIKTKLAKKKRIKRNQSKQSSGDESVMDKKLMLSYTGKQQYVPADSTTSVTTNKSEAKQDKPPAITSKPYLIISSGNINSNEHTAQPSLSLRLETQIDFTRTETSSPIMNSDVMDEVTVMANRLAHLEKQIISLQNKNTQLLKEAEQAKNANLQLSEQKSQWLQDILIAFGVITGLAGAEWLRRKTVRARLNKEQAIWFDAEEDADTLDNATNFSANETEHAKETILNESAFNQSIFHQPSSQNPTESYSFADEAGDSGDNILENADVFIEHDRPALAIQLLQNHLSDFPTESPKIWLKLLGLLATEGSETEYDKAVAECKNFFNIKMPSFADATIPDDSSIEEFPHIVSRLEGVWGSQFAVGFLSDLIYNQFAQPREGFERGTFEELFFLKQIAETLSANISKEQSGFYQPAGIKPASDNAAFNDVAFGSGKLLNDTKVSDDVKSSSQVPLAEENKSASFTRKNTYDMESSPFQSVPSYEVDMLLDFDDALEMQNNTAADKLNPSSTTTAEANTMAEESTSLKADEALQSDVASTSPPAEALFEAAPHLETSSTIENTTESAGQNQTLKESKKETNVIEWDLPKLD
jgi:hypothetical protein